MTDPAACPPDAPRPGCVAIRLCHYPEEPKWRVLEFPQQQQEHSNWCWAAIAVNVASFFRPSSTYTQCKIANAELGRQDCCSGASAEKACNVYGFLMSSLNRVRHFRKWRVLKARSVDRDKLFDELGAEINSKRPLCARLLWVQGGAHFVTIVGYALGDKPEYGVAIEDSWWGSSDLDFADFPEHYRTAADWSDSYYTKS